MHLLTILAGISMLQMASRADVLQCQLTCYASFSLTLPVLPWGWALARLHHSRSANILVFALSLLLPVLFLRAFFLALCSGFSCSKSC